MDIFDLPLSTEFGRVVPKNAFDEYTNTKQKKLISDVIQRITWTHKLSTDTTNLIGIDIEEIQVFKVELNRKNDLRKVLDLFDKAIPYHIVFVLMFEDEYMISTSAKHTHQNKADEAVIDCTFYTIYPIKTRN